MTPKVRVYIACSLDGFIAGPEDDLSWLPGADDPAHESAEAPKQEGGEDGSVDFESFLAQVGALLMGRRTYDVVAGFGGPWPYGERPVLVATHRPLAKGHATVRAARGDIGDLVADARRAAAGRDVYIDGGQLIRQALDARLVDDIIVTLAPIILGSGHALFAGTSQRHALELVGHHRFGREMVQLRYRPLRS